MRLKDKAAIITGGGERIGRATALLFCKEGAKVGIMGRTRSKLDRVVEEAEGSVNFMTCLFFDDEIIYQFRTVPSLPTEKLSQ
ncbi:MAG TPA: SDR family NAD(P)-dependent oxidoreductase [Thermodesulfobacteriota bacterium]